MSMTLIEHIEVGSGGAASITFMNVGDIPSDYTDLLIVMSVRCTDTDFAALIFQFNGSSTGYSARNLTNKNGSAVSGTWTTATSNSITGGRLADGWITSSGQTASTFSSASFYIPNYRSSVAKSFSLDTTGENNGTGIGQELIAGLWTGTDPITSITLTPQSSTDFVQYSSATLYGITAGSDGVTTVS